MKYILISIITISIMYTFFKITEWILEGVDKLFDYWERKRNERKM